MSSSRPDSDRSDPSQPGEPGPRPPSSIIMRRGSEAHTLKYYAGETILETARRWGISIPFNCERGECGTCIVTVLSGAVKMRANDVLSEDDIRSGLTLGCQSVPLTETVEIELP